MAVAKVGRSRRPRLIFDTATVADAEAIATLRNRAADRLTEEFGGGHWSSLCTEKGVAQGIGSSRVLVARTADAIVATLTLQGKKPWAIDPAYFAASERPIYLINMAVDPVRQRRGVGRALIEYAKGIVLAWPGDAIRLDAYDAPAGAGGFYSRCGFQEMGRVTYRATPLIYYELLLERPSS